LSTLTGLFLSRIFVSQLSEVGGAIPNFWKRVIGPEESSDRDRA